MCAPKLFFTRPGAVTVLGSPANLSIKYVERLKEIDGVAEAMPVIRYIAQGAKGFGFEQIEGVEWGRVRGASMRFILTRASPPRAADEVVIDEVKARNSKTEASAKR